MDAWKRIAGWVWLSVGALCAQDLNVAWSGPIACSNRTGGFFEEFIGAGDHYVYARFVNLAFGTRRRNREVRVVAYDRQSMRKAGEARILSRASASDKDYHFVRAFLAGTRVCAVYKRYVGDSTVVYVSSFTEDLARDRSFVRLFAVSRRERFILATNTATARIFLARESVPAREGNLRVDYILADDRLHAVASGHVEVPVKVSRGRLVRGQVCTYQVGTDGFIYMAEDVLRRDDNDPDIPAPEKLIIRTDPFSGESKSSFIRLPGKRIASSVTMPVNGGLRMAGFFSDLSQDENGADLHGIYSLVLDSSNFTPAEPRFAFFEKEYLDLLFAGDKERLHRIASAKSSVRHSREVSLDPDYQIEAVDSDSSGTVLFASVQRNWTNLVCSGFGAGRGCHEYPHCTKKHVTVFRLNRTGDVTWASHLDRSVTYDSWDVRDVRVVRHSREFLVAYGSAFQIGARARNRRTRKSDRQMTDRFEYARFNGTSGDYAKYEYQVNRPGTRGSSLKFIAPELIQVFGGEMFTCAQRTRLKPATYFAILIPPVFYFMILSGNSYTGEATLARIAP